MASEDQIVDALQRASFSALTYYLELPVDDTEFDLATTGRWCLEPLGPLPSDVAQDAEDLVQRVIVDPTANRETFIALLHSIEEPAPK